jgi:hypothetical protein
MALGDYGTSFGDPYMATETVDEVADMTDMQGPSSMVNQLAGRMSWRSSPTRCLVALWFAALAAYWLTGVLFRGNRK